MWGIAAHLLVQLVPEWAVHLRQHPVQGPIAGDPVQRGDSHPLASLLLAAALVLCCQEGHDVPVPVFRVRQHHLQPCRTPPGPLPVSGQ